MPFSSCRHNLKGKASVQLMGLWVCQVCKQISTSKFILILALNDAGHSFEDASLYKRNMYFYCRFMYRYNMQKISIIIPAYNEAQTIAHVLLRIISTPLQNLDKEILVIDDCSNDGTSDVLKNFCLHHPTVAIRCFRQSTNQGKGAAIHRGIAEASGDFIVIQDADLEYDPGEYSELLRPITDGYADVVYGSRFMGSKPHRILFFWHTIGNKFLTFLSNMFTNLNLTDMETCYKLFKAEILKSIRLKEKRFGFEPEVTAKVAQYPGVRIYEVGISYYGRTYEEGKKINWKDGFRAIWCILKYNIWSRK